MGNWKVIKNQYAPDACIYQVVKQIRDDEPLHSGNIKVAGTYDSEDDAEFQAAQLNFAEGRNKERQDDR